MKKKKPVSQMQNALKEFTPDSVVEIYPVNKQQKKTLKMFKTLDKSGVIAIRIRDGKTGKMENFVICRLFFLKD
jgi:hypothetical protein